jgi:hypothetical protein
VYSVFGLPSIFVIAFVSDSCIEGALVVFVIGSMATSLAKTSTQGKPIDNFWRGKTFHDEEVRSILCFGLVCFKAIASFELSLSFNVCINPLLRINLCNTLIFPFFAFSQGLCILP